MTLVSLFEKMVELAASDLFLSVGAPPYLKVEGEMSSCGAQALNSAAIHELIYSIVNDEQAKLFEATSELNFSLHIKSIGRFRVNVFRQMGEKALVARHIKNEVPSIEALGLPVLLKDLILESRGLVLLVGGTGTGKSTTLASMIDYRNSHKTGHILTIEDPVEFVHSHKQSLVNQREVGVDTESYSVALKNSMREAPDVIMIGEIRDVETMQSAIAYAETGHLCVSTLHANNANQAIDRIINFFPENAHSQILKDLAMNLRAIVSQRLPVGSQGKRVAAIEILLNTPYISSLIAKGEIEKIKEAMLQSKELGCQTFDGALFDLVQLGKIDEDVALKIADSKTNLALRFKLEGKQDNFEVKIKKDVSFSRFVDFTVYKSYRIKCVKASEDYKDRVQLFEQGIKAAMFHKGLREESEEPDLEIQYVFAAKQRDARNIKPIEDSISSEVDLNKYANKQGFMRINILDVSTNKPIWQVSASRELAIAPRAQSHINKDIEYLFSEFPPEL